MFLESYERRITRQLLKNKLNLNNLNVRRREHSYVRCREHSFDSVKFLSP